MAEEIDDSGFYREDFSTDSEWEVFNAQLSEIFQQWELSNVDWGRELQKNELFRCQWHVQIEKLQLLQKDIVIYYYKAKLNSKEGTNDTQTAAMHQDLMSVHNTFDPALVKEHKQQTPHTLARLYGLRRFVLMHPVKQSLSNPSEFSFFLSAAAVVAAETNATVPIFVQVFDPKWHFYMGVGLAPTLRTNFNVIALEQSPTDCLYLSGLLSIFKEKHPATYVRPAKISVRNTYNLAAISVRIPMNIPFTKNSALEDESAAKLEQLSSALFTALPSGYFPDSSTDVYATYTWPEIAENIVIDSPLRSDFVPSKAPFRSVHQEVYAISYLSTCVRDFCTLSGVSQTVESFVGRNFSGAIAEHNNPLEKLTQPRIAKLGMQLEKRAYLSATQQTQLKKLPGPMTESELEQMLIYLLPYMHADTALFPYPDNVSKQEFDPHRIKSAYPDSLVFRLSCLLATCNAHFGGKSGLAQLWAAFVRELRVLWDCCLPVPGISPGYPDTRTCLLHQKLQILNICMERRALRETTVVNEATTPASALIESVSSDEIEDEEFYDCEDPSTSGSVRAEGREKRLGNKRLVDCDEPLYVPMLQEQVPKTEDQLQDDAEAMLKLGPGSGLSTQMMCSSLLSDMEAFKAANPKAGIEDFIRWYSPNDWIEETQECTEAGETEILGKLSARMQAADNMWQIVWQQAKPVPAWRQKRLFDDTNEALNVLKYLENRTIGEIYELTVVPLLHAAVLKFKDIVKSTQMLDLFETQIDVVLADICRMSRDVEIIGQTDAGSIVQTPNPEPIIEQLELLETQFYQLKCLQKMNGYPELIDLSELKAQFREMLEQDGSFKLMRRDAQSEDDVISKLLSPEIIKNEMREKLISKDYVLRIDGDITSNTKGLTGPQFLRAIVTGDKIRICGAFTDSTTFI